MTQFILKLLAVGFLLGVGAVPAMAEESPMFSHSEDPERILQIKKATELMRTQEVLPFETLDEILKEHEGLRFSANPEEQVALSKPVFDWINNNLFDKIEKPFVGYFPLVEDGATLGFVVVKKEITELPVIYLLSEDGDLKQLTRRL